MRLLATEQRFNGNNKNIYFSGSQTKYIADKPFRFLGNMNGLHQRAALGTAALIFQPIIDYNNPMTDEKTRKFSVLKSIVKAIVGTSTGLVIRAIAMKVAHKKLKDPQKFLSKIKNQSVKDKMQAILADPNRKKTFESNFGTILGLVGVFIGDFTFDLPLAKFGIQHAADKLGMSEYDKSKSEAKK